MSNQDHVFLIYHAPTKTYFGLDDDVYLIDILSVPQEDLERLYETDDIDLVHCQRIIDIACEGDDQ